jgi:hypothetical protein
MTDPFREYDAPRTDDPTVRGAWLRRFSWPSARDDHLIAALGADPLDWGTFASIDTDPLLGACTVCEHLGWDRQQGHSIGRSVVRDAQRVAREIVERVTARVWRLAASRSPGDQIIGAARAELDREDAFVPDDVLIPACRRIAYAAVKPRPSRVRIR